MRTCYLICFLCCFFCLPTAHTQSVYYFQFSSPTSADTSVYHAFFVRYNDGSGFMRIRHDAGGLVLAEMNLMQVESEISPGVIDTTRMSFDTVGRSRFIFGSSKTNVPVPVFWFVRSNKTGTFDPIAVTIKDSRGMVQPAKMLLAQQISGAALDRKLVSMFFTPGEDFYVNSLEITPRGFTPLEKKTRLHLLIVANTKDSSIGKSCAVDVGIIQHIFDSISRYIGINMLTTIISGNTYNKANVEKALKTLSPEPNDIVVFFYAGHGFRKATDPRYYPYIDLRPKEDNTYMVNSLNIEDIFNTIRNKPKSARLNIVISDCCNTVPEAPEGKGKLVVGFRDIRDWSEDNVRRLFMNPSPQSILMTAADIGQTASFDTTAGSFFTVYFKSAIENNIMKFKKNVNWDQVMIEARTSTSIKAAHTYCERPFIPENICKQVPVPKIVFGRLN